MFTKFITAAAIVTVSTTVAMTSANAGAPRLGVSFDSTPRVAGNGYSAAQPTRTVTAPRGILKTSTATRAPKPRASFTKFSKGFAKQPTAIQTLKRGQKAQNVRMNNRMQTRKGKQVTRAIAKNRDALRHQGDVARHARKKASVTKTLQAKATPRVPSRTIKAGQRAQAKRIVAKAPARTLKAGKVARNARKGVKTARYARTTTQVAKTAKSVKKYKALTAGVGVMAAETVLGTDLPDAVDAAMWTVNTLKDPKNAHKAVYKLGKDTVKKTVEIGKTLTNPKKMLNNTVNGVKSVGKTTVKIAKAISTPKKTVKKISKSVAKAGKSIGKAAKKLKFW